MIAVNVLIVILSCLVIWKASDYFEEATEWIGRNLSDGVKGASLNAIASSMPELFTSFIFLFFLGNADGYSGTIGTTAGSAVFNSLVIPGLVILAVTMFFGVKNISISKKIVMRDGLFLLFSEIVLIFIISSNVITWVEGAVLVLLYVAYLFILFWKKKGVGEVIQLHERVVDEVNAEYKYVGFKAWLVLSLSTIVMMIACYGLVHSVEFIGSYFDIPLIFVSVILAAAASSVPDTIISVRSAKKGDYDDAISNALGSNIFDVTLSIGLPLFVYTVMGNDIIISEQASEDSFQLRIALLILTAITFVVYLGSKKLTKWSGYFMLGLYSLFIGVVTLQILNIL